MKMPFNAWLALIFVSLILLLMALLIHPVRAHDHARPGLVEWLKTLKNQNKDLCCDGTDTDAIDAWEADGRRFRVKFRGEWYEVPESAMVDGPNKSGGALLWMNKGYIGYSVRCFMPGTLS